MSKKKSNEPVVVNPGGAPVAAPPITAPPPQFAPPPTNPTPMFAPPPSAPPSAPMPANPFFNPAPQAAPIAAYSGPINADDFAMQIYLKGTDVPANETFARCKIVQFVKIQGSRSPLVAQIEPVHGKNYLPLNKTNIKQLSAFVGKNLAAAIGRTVVMVVYPVNNPQSGQMTRGLYVGAVE